MALSFPVKKTRLSLCCTILMLYQQQNGEKSQIINETRTTWMRWVGGYSRGSLSANIGYILPNRIAVEAAAAVAPWDNSLLKVGYSIPFFRMTCTRRERSIQTTWYFFSFYSSTSSYYLVDTTEKPFNAQCKHICYWATTIQVCSFYYFIDKWKEANFILLS